jgi:hypothetical protein
MTNNKQQAPQENPNNQFSNSEPMTFAQKVEYVKSTEMTNNKQQTAMKLYTEEQVRKAIELSRDTHPQGRGYVVKDEYDYSMDEVVDLLTPIELPSDDEIVQRSKEEPENSDIETAARIGYVAGAKWMRNKIQGGN